jgi:hypothetical protein
MKFRITEAVRLGGPPLRPIRGAGCTIRASPAQGPAAHKEGVSVVSTTTVPGGSLHKADPKPAQATRPEGPIAAVLQLASEDEEPTHLADGQVMSPRPDEHFLPVTKHALVDRLTRPQAWQPGVAREARRFFRYLDYWRQQRHAMRLMRLTADYEPFSPDSDLFVTSRYSVAERREMQARVVAGVETAVRQANYTVVPREKVADAILSKESHYGLDLKVDFDAFEELLVCYRGESVARAQRRKISSFFRKEEFTVPIYRRLMLLFKLKSVERHVADVRRDLKLSQEEAEKLVHRSRAHIPEQISSDNIYIKIFKNIPKSDVEMVFPNTEVKFRTQDKVWLGVTGGGALGAGVFGAAGKLALAFSNPVTAAGAVGGIGMVLFRQIMNVMNQKNKYMRTLAQNLYFHAMADNRGAITKLADRAAEEDFKEEILLYSVLAKEPVRRSELREVDSAIQDYIEHTFGLQVDFELDDALGRLIEDGLVSEAPDGTLKALQPAAAADHIDAMWDRILDMLPDMSDTAGQEIDQPNTAALGYANGAARS